MYARMHASETHIDDNIICMQVTVLANRHLIYTLPYTHTHARARKQTNTNTHMHTHTHTYSFMHIIVYMNLTYRKLVSCTCR